MNSFISTYVLIITANPCVYDSDLWKIKFGYSDEKKIEGMIIPFKRIKTGQSLTPHLMPPCSCKMKVNIWTILICLLIPCFDWIKAYSKLMHWSSCRSSSRLEKKIKVDDRGATVPSIEKNCVFIAHICPSFGLINLIYT